MEELQLVAVPRPIDRPVESRPQIVTLALNLPDRQPIEASSQYVLPLVGAVREW